MSNPYEFFNSPFFTSLLQGFSTGAGITLGAWMIQHNIIKRIETIEKKIGDKLGFNNN
jgi:hypothetical protein